MGYNNKQKNKRSRKKNNTVVHDNAPANFAAEKQKARDLRKTAWWRKKISSGKCHYCGRAVSPEELTMDHVIPLARGGTSEKINLVPACKECNNKKKHLLPVEWEEYMNSLKKLNDD